MLILSLGLFLLLKGPILVPEIISSSDTLEVATSGLNNRVLVNSISVDSHTLFTDSINVTGTITQKGLNNHVEIFSNVDSIVKKQQTPIQKHKIKITQSGKNNSVKINSR
ncbi:hypothetical protein [Draconibacterium halophilum]|uniref:Uncharacterized protein n=1 Tax=Draconibacterium halophilum TaxID=2706887 RepID=A0A6C0RCE4_9BACT|nr:hypothetical protein [Draconibacterium halophilum]QIA08154.1 hypothetical protein G0Q07_10685 [Draconibacterium halophilum]